ncbi:hypothetical protein ACFSZS_28490 [Seohaeicola zhoushanensis]
MDFTISPRVEDFRARIADFVENRILPVEADRSNWDAHENIAPEPLEKLRAQARAEGLWCLQLRPKRAGRGLAGRAWRSAMKR